MKERSDHFDDIKKPLWFVYSGMGSQWTGMGKELLRIPLFAAAIERLVYKVDFVIDLRSCKVPNTIEKCLQVPQSAEAQGCGSP